MKAYALAVGLTVLASASVLAQVDYDRHVLFDNSLPDSSYYYSEGSVVPPSDLELVHGKLPVERRQCVSPPNCLRLNWRSESGGDWRLTLDLRKHWGNIDRAGSELSFWVYSENELGANLWGIYGFRDGFNLTENCFEDVYLGLNQAPIVVMIENYRSGLIWDLFMSNPEIGPALEAIGFEEDA